MPLARFTLLDDVYLSALRRVVEAFGVAGIPVCLVGGGAAQAWIATLRTGEGTLDLSAEPILESALRETQDLDFATRCDESAALRLLNDLALRNPGTHVLGPRSARLGPVSVSLTLQPNDLSGMASLYDRFLESRTVVRLREKNRTDDVPTIALEELLVTKVTRRGDKAKDLVDVAQLLEALKAAGKALDFGAIRSMLAGRDEALLVMDEIERQWRES